MIVVFIGVLTSVSKDIWVLTLQIALLADLGINSTPLRTFSHEFRFLGEVGLLLGVFLMFNHIEARLDILEFDVL